jgi:hypothetical protein
MRRPLTEALRRNNTLTVEVVLVTIMRSCHMPYTRPYRRFYLTPPAVPTFVISALLAVVALLAAYGHLTILHGVSAFTILLIAYVVLLIGNLLRGV